MSSVCSVESTEEGAAPEPAALHEGEKVWTVSLCTVGWGHESTRVPTTLVGAAGRRRQRLFLRSLPVVLSLAIVVYYEYINQRYHYLQPTAGHTPHCGSEIPAAQRQAKEPQRGGPPHTSLSTLPYGTVYCTEHMRHGPTTHSIFFSAAESRDLINHPGMSCCGECTPHTHPPPKAQRSRAERALTRMPERAGSPTLVRPWRPSREET